jgi:hypothetical protein
MSGMGRHVSFDQAVAWKVLGEDSNVHCLASVSLTGVLRVVFSLERQAHLFHFCMSKAIDCCKISFALSSRFENPVYL